MIDLCENTTVFELIHLLAHISRVCFCSRLVSIAFFILKLTCLFLESNWLSGSYAPGVSIIMECFSRNKDTIENCDNTTLT
uniref:Ovule protein n=1 Tax=Panagrolaimus sp. JU765 TaxID=591449 RepID=A0AC34Q5Y2_9BILA